MKIDKTIITLRVAFLFLSLMGCFAFWGYSEDTPLWQVLTIGMGIATLTLLIDIAIKGFSIRGLTALSFGLGAGLLVSYLITISPLFEPMNIQEGFEDAAFLIRLITFLIILYLSMVITLRGKDDFNLVIPYIRFTPQNTETPIALLDTSALIDGRILPICKQKWLSHKIIIPKFILSELQTIADSKVLDRKQKGKRGLEVLNELKKLSHLQIKISESSVPNEDQVDAKLIYLAVSMHASIITLDRNLSKIAEFQGVTCLNIDTLFSALSSSTDTGSILQLSLVKRGKDQGQAIGYLPNGNMVIVENSLDYVGKTVQVIINSSLQSGNGKIYFAKIHEKD